MKAHLVLIAGLLSSVSFAAVKNICTEKGDTRVASFEPQIARSTDSKFFATCTITMISRSCAISAGHCNASLSLASFNIRTSSASGAYNIDLEDMYLKDPSYLKYESNGSGNDWAVFRLAPNFITQKLPGEAQGYLEVRFADKTKVGEKVKITGYGNDDTLETNISQQTAVGSISKIGGLLNPSAKIIHSVDTMGGNSWSAIISLNDNKVIGIHSHGACSWPKANANENSGTIISRNSNFKAAIKSCLKLEKEELDGNTQSN